VTIEDAAELQFEPAARAATRVTPKETSRAKARSGFASSFATRLRMRPDRIIVGEVRGAESLDMLQAMNTGHDGLALQPCMRMHHATRSRGSRRWC